MRRLGLFRRKCAETETLTATCKANPSDLNVHRDASLAGQPLTSKSGRQLFPRHGCDSRDRWWPVTCTNNDSRIEPLRSFNHPSASRTGFSVLYFCLCLLLPLSRCRNSERLFAQSHTSSELSFQARPPLHAYGVKSSTETLYLFFFFFLSF